MEHLYLIRHGATADNLRRLYLGQKDVPLCAEGIAQARQRKANGVPQIEALFSSPLTRCLQTAQILFPENKPVIMEKFIEIDFGHFEGRHHDDLLHNLPEYKIWLASAGEAPIPGGESMAQLRARVREGFFEMLRQAGNARSVAAVVHGGTIMALMAELRNPPARFWDGSTQNCEIVRCRWDGRALIVQKGVEQ